MALELINAFHDLSSKLQEARNAENNDRIAQLTTDITKTLRSLFAIRAYDRNESFFILSFLLHQKDCDAMPGEVAVECEEKILALTDSLL